MNLLTQPWGTTSFLEPLRSSFNVCSPNVERELHVSASWPRRISGNSFLVSPPADCESPPLLSAVGLGAASGAYSVDYLESIPDSDQPGRLHNKMLCEEKHHPAGSSFSFAATHSTVWARLRCFRGLPAVITASELFIIR